MRVGVDGFQGSFPLVFSCFPAFSFVRFFSLLLSSVSVLVPVPVLVCVGFLGLGGALALELVFWPARFSATAP